MVIDAGTLRDLDVLSTSTVRGHTLIQIVDRTRTRVGAEHLRRRLKIIASTADEVVALRCAGTVEAMWSLGVATGEHRWCHPTAAERLAANGLRHPFRIREGVSLQRPGMTLLHQEGVLDLLDRSAAD